MMDSIDILCFFVVWMIICSVSLLVQSCKHDCCGTECFCDEICDCGSGCNCTD